MRITPRIALVGSGQLGFDLSDPLDCNVYLLDCGGELALIDSGAGRDVDALLAVVRADGYDPARIRHVLLTHAHADHAGGCAALRERLGATVWASAEAGQWLHDGNEAAISLDVARAAGGYPADYRLHPCPAEHTLHDGVSFQLGDYRITPIATPGHADGHMAFLLNDGSRQCLFVGDLVLCGGQVLLQYTHDCSIPQLGASLLRLAELPVDALFPGHLHFCLRNGRRHIALATDRLRQLRIPRSLS